jgi:hypothetical protein
MSVLETVKSISPRSVNSASPTQSSPPDPRSHAGQRRVEDRGRQDATVGTLISDRGDAAVEIIEVRVPRGVALAVILVPDIPGLLAAVERVSLET